MDVREFLENKLSYNHSANEQWINHIHQLEKQAVILCQKRLSHIFNAHHIWNQRILEQPSKYGIWDIHPQDNWLFINDQLTQQTCDILRDNAIQEVVTYKSTSGQAYRNTVGEIIYHLINHSTYHRGQLSLILSNAGYTSLSSDYIYYSRVSI